MGIFGFDSISDMFDGGGAGGSGDSFYSGSNEDYVATGGTNTGSSPFSNDRHDDGGGGSGSAVGNSVSSFFSGGSTMTNQDRINQIINDEYGGNSEKAFAEKGDELNALVADRDGTYSGGGIGGFFGSGDGVKGKAPSGIMAALGYASPIGVVGKLAGWANGLDPKDDINRSGAGVVDGRQVYVNADGMQYSYNFLGLPYEVKVQDGKVVDALSIKGDDGLTGYERMAQEARDRGDNDEADAIMQEAADNAKEPEEAETNESAAINRFIELAQAAGIATSNEEINAMIADPEGFLSERGLTLRDVIPNLDAETEGTLLDPDDPRYTTSGDVTYDPTLTDAETVDVPNQKPVGSVNTDTSADRLDNPQYQVDPVTGEVRDENLVNADDYTLDMKGSATGVNEDGTTNYTGLALNEYASVDISRVIDTSTVAGKLLADKLGEGGYTDAKATVLGQMKIISEEFKGPNGDPVIPPWAQGTHRNVSRTIAFTGMSGSAAVAASANAIMEASLPIAEKDAAFFQTLTLENLSNRQQSIINKANVLAKFDLANLSAREAAAVQNAKTFLEMDLTNLANEQQSEVINVQNRVDAMFTDVAEENVNRRFNITNEMENRQFYDTLAYNAATFNANVVNANREANANRTDAALRFGIENKMARDQFNATMARVIDESNVAWRREVETTNTRMEFEAAAADVRNALGITTEGMNRLWDRVDSQLDYIWRSTEADEQRDFELLLAEMQAAAAAAAGKASSKGSIWGAIIGAGAKIGAEWLKTKWS